MRAAAALVRCTSVGLILAAVAGCGHRLTLLWPDGTIVGTGFAASQMGYSGTLEADLAGKHYNGEWVAVAEGGGVGAVNTVGTTPSFGVFAIGGTTSNGRATLRAADGSTLRCQFRYSDDSGTGLGQCEDGRGTVYDLHIN